MESELEDDKGTSKSESTANDSDCANQDASLSKNPMSNVKKKTRADYQKAYRQRLKEKNTRTQIQKSDEQKRRKAANSKAYRERKKRLRQEGKMQKYSTRESPVFQSQRENPFETVGIYEARTQAPNKIEKNKQQTKIGKTVSPIKQQSEQQEYIKDYDEIVPFISQPMEQNNVNPNQTNIIEVDRHVYIEVEMNEDEFQEVDDNEFREPDPFHQPDQNEDQVQINEQSIQNPFGHACDRFWLKNDLKLVKDDREDILRRNIQKPTTSVKRASLATVVCPNCNTKVKLEDIEAPMVDTRTVIAKVYHFLEREYSALKEKFGDLDLSPFLKFRARTAEATGVSEKTVSKILKEEQELIQVPPQVKRASKRKRYQDSPVMEEREQAEPEIEAVEIKVEPPDDETYTEQAELEIETVEIKVEPPEDETYTEQAGSVSDMLAVHTEPADDHLQNSKQNFLLIDAGKIVMRQENKEEPEEYTFHEPQTQGKTSTTEYSTNIAHNDVELGKKSDKEVGTTKEINIKIEEIEFTEGFT